MNCKPGDLAYIIGGHATPPRNIGRVVEVISLEGVFDGLGQVWNVQSSKPCETVSGFKDKFHMRDAWLRPIAGPSVTEESNRRFLNPIVLTDDLLESIGVRS